MFSNFHQNLIANQVEPKIGDTCNARLYNHYGLSITGNRKLNRASKSNHVEDKSWYYMESIIFPLPWKILTSSRLPISRFPLEIGTNVIAAIDSYRFTEYNPG